MPILSNINNPNQQKMPNSEREGITVRSVTVAWAVKRELVDWAALSAVGRTSRSPARRTAPRATTTKKKQQAKELHFGPILPSEEKPYFFSLSAFADVDGHSGFGLRRAMKPKSAAPLALVRSSELMGGVSGLFGLLGKAGLLSKTLPAKYTVRFRVGDPWHCRILPQPVEFEDSPLAAFGERADQEEVGYRFDGGTLGLTELSVTFVHLAKEFQIDLQAMGVLETNSDLELPYADKLIALVVDSIFTKN